ncbi:MAG: ABC transporter permease subunit [Promethearchaeota archaeon]
MPFPQTLNNTAFKYDKNRDLIILTKKITKKSIKFKRFFKSNSFFIFISILGSFLLLLIIFSLVDIFVRSLILNIETFLAVLVDGIVLKSIFLTFYASFLATLIAVIFGIPLSYMIARYDFKGKIFIESIINVPLMIPHSVAGLLIYSLFMRRGVIGAPLKQIGIIFEDNIWGIVVALLFVSMPIFINNAKDGFKSINPHFERVAYSLGANQRQTFIKVVFPLTKRHIFTGAIMCWARGISEFGAVLLIAYYPMIAPILVYYRFNTQGLEGSGAIAVLLIILSLIIFIILYFLTKEREFKEENGEVL